MLYICTSTHSREWVASQGFHLNWIHRPLEAMGIQTAGSGQLAGPKPAGGCSKLNVGGSVATTQSMLTGLICNHHMSLEQLIRGDFRKDVMSLLNDHLSASVDGSSGPAILGVKFLARTEVSGLQPGTPSPSSLRRKKHPSRWRPSRTSWVLNLPIRWANMSFDLALLVGFGGNQEDTLGPCLGFHQGLNSQGSASETGNCTC